MNWRTKIAIILLCAFLCGVGAYLASTVHEKNEPQRMNATPVKNRDVVRRIWIQVRNGGGMRSVTSRIFATRRSMCLPVKSSEL